MTGNERRQLILEELQSSKTPISGGAFAKLLKVSRQIVVQDIALMRAHGIDIHSTNKGYVISKSGIAKRVFKVIHSDEEVEEELTMIVDLGGKIKDVFVYHKVYGLLKAELNIRSRLDVNRYMDEIHSGKSTPLKNITSGYHYHTIEADDESILNLIKDALAKRGFLAKLQDYEPVDFWKD
ncbi:transcription repressor NadR [Lachnobacterium bovis]|uniref:Transcription repressor NadR n=1 Tax=Lachnobacterium bovis DSM 14045 TaxID=1122142 RepID=A0A1H3LDN1_9FIRM|nr:transcription repressor NadR [Lachnobacterium bovis]MBQ1802195.1 transcription repressor NadR [Lachnobacterium sp.]SDY62513.1 hypothetical protein SAMN02910414_01976 [Lachnobacterium bovis DSM 14045]